MGIATGTTTPCPSCRRHGNDKSGDNLVHFEDGSKHCFACGYDEQPKHTSREELTGMLEFNEIASLPIKSLPHRRIRQDVAELYGVRCEIDEETGKPAAYYYPLYRKGQLAGYSYKAAHKPGEQVKGGIKRVYADPASGTRGCAPFGAHIHPAGSSRMIIVTEGEEDTLAVTSLLASSGKKYRTVATLGAGGWKSNLEYFESFDKVVIAYDMDSVGKTSAKSFAEALTPGKAVIMKWDDSCKDPNDLLYHPQGPKLFLDSLFQAQAPEVGGIIYGEEAWRVIQNYSEPEYIPYPPEFDLLNAKLKGMRRGEISLWTSGTGCGKSSFMRRIKQHVIQSTPWKLGDVELEESKEKTIRAMLQYQGRKPLVEMSKAEKRAAYEATYGTNKLFTVDRRSRLSKGASLLAQLKHLHHAFGCDIIMLDHITLAQDELGDGREGLAAQDKMMADLLELVESTGVHIALISHLRKTTAGGKSFEEGAMPSLDELKGSGSIKQISFDIIALGRNLQHPDYYQRNVTQLRVLKNREFGNVGDADRLFYNKETYTFEPARDEEEAGEDSDF